MRAIDSVEFSDWVAYYNIEPFGERVADIRAATIASTMANIHRAANTPAFEALDFMPWARPPAVPIEITDKKAHARLVALAVFGVDLDKYKGKRKKYTVKRRASGRQ